ncbi:MAG: tyrosine recombinase XerD [Marinilabiliaceae bacterium]|nr:tyrosine recombinase XerD [Marinilabiliaceae bacterium]
MNWDKDFEDFEAYLKLQKGLSKNSIQAYITDLQKLFLFLKGGGYDISAECVDVQQLRDFLQWLAENGISARTQARIISGIKQFFKSLLIEERIEKEPTALLDVPRVGRKLPSVLSLEQVVDVINAVDDSRQDGQRNRAILVTLYSCGLRVSELVELKISNISFENNYIRVEGKGRKERLVPMNQKVSEALLRYIEGCRNLVPVNPTDSDIVFLNKRGEHLSRVMVFYIIKKAVKDAGLDIVVSPHTFRHSFATHLIAGGANVRAVQEMLGHESIITTEIYTHLDHKYLEDSIKKHPRS